MAVRFVLHKMAASRAQTTDATSRPRYGQVARKPREKFLIAPPRPWVPVRRPDAAA